MHTSDVHIIGFDQISRTGYRYRRLTLGNLVFIHLCFSFLFVSRDKVLEETSLNVRILKWHAARKIVQERLPTICCCLCTCTFRQAGGLEIRTLEVFNDEGLREPFTAACFANRNVELLQEDGGITLYVQNSANSQEATPFLCR